MKKFKGFKSGPVEHIKLPSAFFTELLPLIDDLAELHVTLFSFWALTHKEGRFRYLHHRDYLRNETLMQSLAAANPTQNAEHTLDEALQRAIERETLLKATCTLNNQPEHLFLINSIAGREAVHNIHSGQWIPGDLHSPIEILPARPNIYRLYESNIGTITPMIAEELKDAETDFPLSWIEEAIRLSVEHNKRNWRYIRAILDRWDREGRDRGLTGKPAQSNGQQYVSGRYAAFINTHTEGE